MTFSQMTPSLFKRLGNNVPNTFKHLLLGGEAFPKIQFPIRDNLKIYNVYGLTEMSVWQSLVNVEPSETSSIPICQKPNLLRETNVKLNDEGEIVVMSKTRACCIDGSWQFEVRTKDLGWQKENGFIYFEGRLDLDVFKVHGRRLSVHEIQAKWTEVFQANSYCVLTESNRLMAYIQTTEVTRNEIVN